jgi:hypothetical protein
MAENLTNVTKDMLGNAVYVLADQAGAAVTDATHDVAKEKAHTLGEQIANHTCDELNKGIPTMISSITERIISDLRQKINSEEFTKDFIDVLQTKILNDNTYSEEFLPKFSKLFDTIILEAKNRYDKERKKKEDEIPPPPPLPWSSSESSVPPPPPRSQVGKGRRKHSNKKRNQKKPTKYTKRIRFSKKI